MIRLEHVSKIYGTAGTEVRALDGLSLDIARGEFVGVCGPSGCGKSTLLSLVGGLTKATSGSIHVADEELSTKSVSELATFRAQHVGFVFQMFHLLPYLDVLGNICVAAAPDTPASDARTRAESLLHQFGLEHRLWHRPGELSAGERQRVAMARALINEPALLLADEPTGNLDPKSADTLLDLLKDFQSGGGTILLVTHDSRAADRADRVIQLEHGRVAEPARS